MFKNIIFAALQIIFVSVFGLQALEALPALLSLTTSFFKNLAGGR